MTPAPVDWVVFLMAGTVCAVVVISMLSSALGGHELNNKKAELLAGILLSMLAIVSLYIGSQL